MKKSLLAFLSVVLTLSFLLTACNGEVLTSPKEAGVTQDGPVVSQVNIFDSANLAGLKPISTIIKAEYGVTIKLFKQPESLQDSMLVFGSTAVMAASDPAFVPGDLIAIVAFGLTVYYVTSITVPFASQAIAQISAIDFQKILAGPTAVSLLTSTLAPTIGENIYLSTRHYESQSVIAGMNGYAKNSRLKKQGDGNSSGSIRMFAGIQPEMKANIAILMVVGTQMNFLVLQGDLLNAGSSVIPGGALDLGSGNYIFTKAAKIICAWTLSKDIGHGQKDPSEFLTVGQGWEYWAVMQQKYNLYTEVVEIQLP